MGDTTSHPEALNNVPAEKQHKILQWLEERRTKENTEEGRQQQKKAKKEDKEDRTPQADKLIQVAAEGVFLFHDSAKDAFASIPFNGHREIWSLKSKFFRQWLTKQFYEREKRSPNSEAIRQALNTLEAKAVFDGPEIKLNLRIAAEHDSTIWYDLANNDWQAVKITLDGWEVVDNPPILFRRFKNTAAQVLPQPGGSLELLKKYVNLQNEDDWLLLFALIVHALVPNVPHGISIFYGDKGSAKTTAQRVIRKLIDPAHRDTMTLPQNKNELALTLTTNYAPCFDNLDGLKPWQSDMLCQAATGGGISKRELYTDTEEVILSFLRCPMLNGINLVASRDDLLDRSVLFRLDRIGKEWRKTESEFWQEFEQDRPFILGAIFDALAGALRIYPQVKLPALPRMADFAQWGYAIMEAVSNSGEKFLEAYYKNITGANEEAVLGDVVGAAVVEFMNDRENWRGTATELLGQLNDLPGVNEKDKAWPKRANTLSRRLNRIKSALADYGIQIIEYRESNLSRTRLLEIRKNIVQTVQTVQKGSEASKIGGFSLDNTLDDWTIPRKISSSPEALKNRALDDMDDMDDILSTNSIGDEEEFKDLGKIIDLDEQKEVES